MLMIILINNSIVIPGEITFSFIVVYFVMTSSCYKSLVIHSHLLFLFRVIGGVCIIGQETLIHAGQVTRTHTGGNVA